MEKMNQSIIELENELRSLATENGYECNCEKLWEALKAAQIEMANSYGRACDTIAIFPSGKVAYWAGNTYPASWSLLAAQAGRGNFLEDVCASKY
jgi:hypothetical protein